METERAAQAFGTLFRRVYLAFYPRHAPTERMPSPESLAVLQHLASTGPLTVGEAAHHFSRSQAATSELFQRLERRGLVERAPDQRDRRRHLVWLTKTGLDAWERSTQVLSSARLEGALRQMPPDHRSELVERLEELITLTERRNCDGSSEPMS